MPDKPFAPGETVTVSSALDINGATEGSYTFAIGQPAALPADQQSLLDELDEVQPMAAGAGQQSSSVTADQPAALAAAPTDPPQYLSRPDLHPPRIHVLSASAGRGQGLLLTAPLVPGAQTQAGMMLHDDAGEVVWFHPAVGTFDGNLQKVPWFGRDALIWFESNSQGLADWVVVDSTYREVARIRAANGYLADIHDVIITDQGTAYVMIYAPVQQDLSPIGGRADAVVIEAVVQEIDLGTGAVLFEWHSLAPGNLPVTDTFAGLLSNPLDYVHLNSMELDDDGSLLLSGRHVSSVTKVDRTTGAVVWRLGGKRSSFTFPNDAGPNWPHDARRRNDGTVSVFDNRLTNQPQYSRGARWQLDEAAMTATLVQEWRHVPDLWTPIVGNVTEMSNGNTMISFGTAGTATEYQGQTAVFETDYADPGVFTYRTYRETWHATPAERPALAVRRTAAGQATASMSWNGATEVAMWRLMAGPSTSVLRVIGTAARSGFETSLSAPVMPTDTVFVARAVAATGAVIGISSAATTPFLSETLGGVTDARPASTSWGPGRMDVVVEGPGAAVWHTGADGVAAGAATAPWSAWESLGGVVIGAPAITSWGPGRLDVFAPGFDGAVWHKWFDGGVWSDWESLGGRTNRAVAAVSWGPGRLDVFVTGPGDALWHKWFDGGVWSEWESLGGQLFEAPSVASWAPGRLDVVVVGPGRGVWHLPFESGVGWYGWNPLGGATDVAPGIAAPAPGVLEVMANATNTVWHRSWVGFWTAWAPLGGPAQSGPGASARSGRTEVFVQGPDRGVWHGVI